MANQENLPFTETTEFKWRPATRPNRVGERVVCSLPFRKRGAIVAECLKSSIVVHVLGHGRVDDDMVMPFIAMCFEEHPRLCGKYTFDAVGKISRTRDGRAFFTLGDCLADCIEDSGVDLLNELREKGGCLVPNSLSFLTGRSAPITSTPDGLRDA